MSIICEAVFLSAECFVNLPLNPVTAMTSLAAHIHTLVSFICSTPSHLCDSTALIKLAIISAQIVQVQHPFRCGQGQCELFRVCMLLGVSKAVWWQDGGPLTSLPHFVNSPLCMCVCKLCMCVFSYMCMCEGQTNKKGECKPVWAAARSDCIYIE